MKKAPWKMVISWRSFLCLGVWMGVLYVGDGCFQKCKCWLTLTKPVDKITDHSLKYGDQNDKNFTMEINYQC